MVQSIYLTINQKRKQEELYKEFMAVTENLHHLVSTKHIPGIYKPIYEFKSEDTIYKIPIEHHLREQARVIPKYNLLINNVEKVFIRIWKKEKTETKISKKNVRINMIILQNICNLEKLIGFIQKISFFYF